MHVLSDVPVDLALVQRLEAAQAAQNREFTPPGGVLDVAGGVALFHGPGSPLSQALGLGLAGPVGDAELDRVEAHLGQGGGPVQLELLPWADPSLAALLGARGYRVQEFQQVLVRALGEEPPAPLPEGVLLRPIRAGEERAFARVVGSAFLGREELSAEEETLLLPRAPGEDTGQGTTCFLAWVDGVLAGGGTVALHGGVATLSGTGVLARFRGRGVQGALIRARLAFAAARGCRLAASSTQPATGSQRNMERQGFRIAYPKVVMVRERA